MKQTLHSKELRPFASITTRAAKAILAVALLLMLVGGSIAWPAAASGPLCTMACCAGRASHAAGSCMHGSCETKPTTGKQASQHSHHHHEQQQAQTSDANSNLPEGFAGATANAMASDMEQVPTIDATASESVADRNAQVDDSQTQQPGSSLSATSLSAPCAPNCGACVSSFSASRQTRASAALAAWLNAQPPSSIKLAIDKYALIHSRSSRYRQFGPRGPPTFSS